LTCRGIAPFGKVKVTVGTIQHSWPTSAARRATFATIKTTRSKRNCSVQFFLSCLWSFDIQAIVYIILSLFMLSFRGSQIQTHNQATIMPGRVSNGNEIVNAIQREKDYSFTHHTKPCQGFEEAIPEGWLLVSQLPILLARRTRSVCAWVSA
jgi:hypothetical protein